MGQAVVRNRASDGVLIKDFTEPGGFHVLIGLAGAGPSIVMQLRQVLTSPAVAQDEVSLTADVIMRVEDAGALASPSLVWSLPAIFLYGDSFGWWNAVALALVAAAIALWLIQIRSAGVATGGAASHGHPMIVIDAASPTPPLEQLRAQLARQIQDRSLAVGTRLPPIRRLAADLGPAVNTVGRAYRELEEAGLTETCGRAGPFVSAAGEPARVPPANTRRSSPASASTSEAIQIVKAALGHAQAHKTIG